ncbi:MAG: hypothetical protein ACYCQJ_16325 [Nitrososphaerales archaeon]
MHQPAGCTIFTINEAKHVYLYKNIDWDSTSAEFKTVAETDPPTVTKFLGTSNSTFNRRGKIRGG